MDSTPRIYVAGHRGMVGGAISRKLRERGVEVITRTHAELNLTDQAAVRAFFASEKPDGVVLAAAKVGGIHANNTYPAEVCGVVIPPLKRGGALPLIAQPLGCDLAPMPLRRQYSAQGFQQRRQRLHESVGRVDDIKACAVIDAGLIAIVQPMLHPQQFRDAELS